MPADKNPSDLYPCRTCGQNKPKGDFHLCGVRAGVQYLRTVCRVCWNAELRRRTKLRAQIEPRVRRPHYPTANGRKTCARCKENKPVQEFARRQGLDPYRCWCKRCARDLHLQKSYGISLSDYDIMLQAQGGVCQICGRPEYRKNQHGPIPLGVDHDHRTGKVRGLLCHGCNSLLGKADDDIQRLRTAADYLERYSH